MENEDKKGTQAGVQEAPVQEESYTAEPMLMRKRPNMFWMAGTILFLVASVLIFYMLSSSGIPTPAQLVANMSAAQAITVNTVQLNLEYKHATSNRGLYEIGAAIVAVLMAGMSAKNLYLTFRS